MKNVFKILHRDIKNIIKNPAAIIVMIGLFFIPSLYAWVNIKANWDPYANTQQIPVAIVNNDNGAVFNNKMINVGDEIVSELKSNDSIGWDFVDDWQGNYGLNEGKYYALIEIPSNFSSQLVSLASTVPQKPEIIYKANEKANAIATKITDVAKDTLTDEIKKEIINTVNKEAFQVLNVTGENIETRKPEILELISSINDADLKLKDINSQLLSVDKDITLIQNHFTNSKEDLNEADKSITSLQNMIKNSRDLTMNTKVQLTILTSNLKQNMIDLQAEKNRYEDLLEDLKDKTSASVNTDSAIKTINEMKKSLKSMNNIIDSIVSSLGAIDKFNPITEEINLLKSVKNINENILSQLDSLQGKLENSSQNPDVQNLINNLIFLNNELNNSFTSISNTFYNTVVPLINVSSDNLMNGADKADLVLDGLRVLNPQVKALMNLGISNGDIAKSQLSDINSKLDDFRDGLSSVEEKTSNIDDGTIDTIVNIMSKNADVMGEFLASPINVEEVKVYNINIFGVGLTPFYTVLGIWVGSLLMLALLTTECKDLDIPGETTVMQKHFGKLLLFLLISFVQTVIVSLGDVYLLKVYPENLPLFFGVSLLTSFAFTVMIYTLVSLFGNVGKAIAVVIMVFQIAGSGGIYPIQTNPKIFGVLQPLWPFTYAIDAFRQAIAGPTWSNTLYDLGILLLFAIVFIILGLLKRHIYKITEFFEEKFKNAQL